MSIDIKKIGTFLKSVDGAEYEYLGHCMGVRNKIQDLIKRYNLSKEEFCSMIGLNPKKYDDFIKGNCNYNINELASLSYHAVRLEAENKAHNDFIELASGEK